MGLRAKKNSLAEIAKSAEQSSEISESGQFSHLPPLAGSAISARVISCAHCALIWPFAQPPRSLKIRAAHRTTHPGLRKYSFAGTAPSRIGIENHTRRAVFARAARVATRIFLQ
jgi:hypothetical protein